MLPLILDANRVAAMLASHLLVADSRIEECRVVRYRHRPNRRTLVQYLARVRDARGQLSEERVTAQWHAAPEQTLAIYKRLVRRAAAETMAWRHAFAPVFRDDVLGIVATTFPFDRRLPALSAVATGAAPDLLAAMLQSMGASQRELRSVQVTPVRYREQLNAVCRYEVIARRDDGDHEAVFFAKLYGDCGGEGVAQLLQALATVTAGRGLQARVQQPVAYHAGLRTLVVHAAPGIALDSHHHLNGMSLDRVLRRIADALVCFARLAAPDQLPRANRTLLEVIERAVIAIADGQPQLSRMAGALGESLPTPLTPQRTGIVHGDVKLEHIFLSGSDVWLIDLDSAHVGEPLWDLALLQARWWAARDAVPNEHGAGERGWDVLEREYLARTSLSAARHLRPLQVAALLDVAAGVIKRREHEWRTRSRRLVEHARTIEQVRP